MKKLVLLNGASGVGKTTTAEQLVHEMPALGFVHPDGRWNTPEMDPESILKLAVEAAEHLEEDMVVIDVQIRPTMIDSLVGENEWKMLLMDCPDDLREGRLLERGWTEENFPTVASWQRILREETMQLGLPVINTSDRSVASCVMEIRSQLEDEACVWH